MVIASSKGKSVALTRKTATTHNPILPNTLPKADSDGRDRPAKRPVAQPKSNPILAGQEKVVVKGGIRVAPERKTRTNTIAPPKAEATCIDGGKPRGKSHVPGASGVVTNPLAAASEPLPVRKAHPSAPQRRDPITNGDGDLRQRPAKAGIAASKNNSMNPLSLASKPLTPRVARGTHIPKPSPSPLTAAEKPRTPPSRIRPLEPSPLNKESGSVPQKKASGTYHPPKSYNPIAPPPPSGPRRPVRERDSNPLQACEEPLPVPRPSKYRQSDSHVINIASQPVEYNGGKKRAASQSVSTNPFGAGPSEPIVRGVKRVGRPADAGIF